MKDRAQQEMVGFVLIVVVVLIALMVFLVISIRSSPEPQESSEVENILSVIMRHTTECAIVYEPNYDTFEDLFKSCYKNNKCSNQDDISACEFLSSHLDKILTALLETEAPIQTLQLDFLDQETEEEIIPRIIKGENPANCTGTVSSAQRRLASDNLVVQISICREDF